VVETGCRPSRTMQIREGQFRSRSATPPATCEEEGPRRPPTPGHGDDSPEANAGPTIRPGGRASRIAHRLERLRASRPNFQISIWPLFPVNNPLGIRVLACFDPNLASRAYWSETLLSSLNSDEWVRCVAVSCCAPAA
jgi:hypothetical protein